MNTHTRLARALLPALALAAGCAGVAPGRATAQEPVANPPEPSAVAHARLRLILDAAEAAPGSTVDLGVSFTIEPGWHLYWKGRNDTGEAPKVRLELPQGVTAGETLWPAPVRHVMDGGILDHIYETRVTLIVPLTIAKDAPKGSAIKIRASGSWLVCKNICVFESGDAETSLRIGAGPDRARSGEHSSTLAAARAAVPKALDPDVNLVETVFTEASGPDSDGVFELRVRGATSLEFYPELDCAELADPIADTRAEADFLRIRLVSSQDNAQKALTGVLAIWKRGATEPAYYSLSVGRAR